MGGRGTIPSVCATCGTAFLARTDSSGLYCKHACFLSRRGTLEERFWSHVAKGDNCWQWSAACSGSMGYGVIRIAGRNQFTHTVSWRLHFGEIPADLRVLHRCDNPPCVRPDHLFLGTQGDNLKDMYAKRRRTSTIGQWKVAQAKLRRGY
jgi:hypothetical protein